MMHQQARARNTRTGQPATDTVRAARKGENRGEQKGAPALAPPPPDLPQAPRTQKQGTAPAKALVVHSATQQLRGETR